VELDRVESAEDVGELLELIKLHQEYTGSTVAQHILDHWLTIVRQEFVKVMPLDYKRVLLDRASHDEEIETAVRVEHASS
jgi:glutamate synthase (NADPH) large chain